MRGLRRVGPPTPPALPARAPELASRPSLPQRIAARARNLLGKRADKFDDSQLLDAAPEDRAIVDAVAPYTLTSPQRRYALIKAVQYLVRRNIPGALVECGVWRGGSALAILMTLLREGVRDRDVWLYDTFDGMTAPTARDRSPFDAPARQTWDAAREAGSKPWHHLFKPDVFNLDKVRALLESTGYPPAHLHFVVGAVEQTLPAQAPERAALLRLDTDWYESTRQELDHLYPRLSSGGVLIVDDYGHWQGCREAVDEYFSAPGREPILLNRIDYTARVALKP